MKCILFLFDLIRKKISLNKSFLYGSNFYKYYQYAQYIISTEIGDNSSDRWKQLLVIITYNL